MKLIRGLDVQKEYWNNLRAAIYLMLFHDFEHQLRYVANPHEI
jgi:hypothetical protein